MAKQKRKRVVAQGRRSDTARPRKTALKAAAWILKTEPKTYSWSDLVRDGSTTWDLVRNYAARNHLQQMKVGDRCYIYHSVGPKALVGTATVTRTAFPDPTATGGEASQGWVAVEIKPLSALPREVTLAEMKADAVLSKMALVRQPRLSVCPVTDAEEKAILALAT